MFSQYGATQTVARNNPMQLFDHTAWVKTQGAAAGKDFYQKGVALNELHAQPNKLGSFYTYNVLYMEIYNNAVEAGWKEMKRNIEQQTVGGSGAQRRSLSAHSVRTTASQQHLSKRGGLSRALGRLDLKWGSSGGRK